MLPGNQSIWLNTAGMLILSVLALLNEQVSVFYMIYLFWWQELIRTIIDYFYFLRNKPHFPDGRLTVSKLKSRFFMLFVYVVFIVVFFGLIMDWRNIDLMIINSQILFFKHLYFNINLLFFALVTSYTVFGGEIITLDSGPFNPRTIVLHMSIVLGVLVHYFVVKRFANVFPEGSLWSSVAVVAPFLLLKLVFDLKLVQSPRVLKSLHKR